MPIFIIRHPSPFITYILAYTIYLYYQPKLTNLQIIIIEYHHGIEDFQPWCATTTAIPMNEQTRMNDVINNLIMEQCLIPLNEITMGVVNTQPNYDRPLHTQHMITSVGIDNYCGYIYHPSLIIHKLRSILLNCHKVTFTSYHPRLGTQVDLIRSVLSHVRHPNGIIIDCGNNDKPLGVNRNLNYLINSNLMGLKCRNKRLVSSVLWIPSLISQLNLLGDGKLTHTIVHQQEPKVIIINLKQDSILQMELLLKVDINYVFLYCEATLTILDGLINYGYIKSLSNKL